MFAKETISSLSPVPTVSLSGSITLSSQTDSPSFLYSIVRFGAFQSVLTRCHGVGGSPSYFLPCQQNELGGTGPPDSMAIISSMPPDFPLPFTSVGSRSTNSASTYRSVCAAFSKLPPKSDKIRSACVLCLHSRSASSALRNAPWIRASNGWRHSRAQADGAGISLVGFLPTSFLGGFGGVLGEAALSEKNGGQPFMFSKLILQ